MPLTNRSNNRADEIRRRRLLQSHAGRQSSGKPASAPLLGKVMGKSSGSKDARRRSAPVTRTPPPVMARGSVAGATRPLERRSKGGRRTHRLTLGSQGAEMTLPAPPRIRLSWRIASFVIAAFLGAALYYLWTTPEFQVQAASVSGLQRLTPGDVNKELALRAKPVFALDAEKLEDQLLVSFPEFSSADVAIDFPNTVLITVTERVPVLAWSQDGRTILIDSDGKTFQARDSIGLGALPVVQAEGDPPPVPDAQKASLEEPLTPEEIQAREITQDVVQEFTPTTMFEPAMVAAILSLDEQKPSSAALVYHTVHGFGWQDSRGWPVFFGDLSDLETKMNAYKAIIEQVKTSGGMPELISVEFVNAPYYRLKNQPEQEAD